MPARTADVGRIPDVQFVRRPSTSSALSRAIFSISEASTVLDRIGLVAAVEDRASQHGVVGLGFAAFGVAFLGDDARGTARHCPALSMKGGVAFQGQGDGIADDEPGREPPSSRRS